MAWRAAVKVGFYSSERAGSGVDVWRERAGRAAGKGRDTWRWLAITTLTFITGRLTGDSIDSRGSQGEAMRTTKPSR